MWKRELYGWENVANEVEVEYFTLLISSRERENTLILIQSFIGAPKLDGLLITGDVVWLMPTQFDVISS